jgi:hypothetical protein
VGVESCELWELGVEGVVVVGCSCRSELGVNQELLYGWSVC